MEKPPFLNAIGRLPVETVERVCLCLDWPSLVDFSLVDKYARGAALPLLFRHLRVHFGSSCNVTETLIRWTERLEEAQAFSHVRSVLLTQQDPTITLHHACDDDSIRDPWRHRATGFRTDEAYWVALPSFLAQFRGLRQLQWACYLQVPSCVVRSIEPTCELEILTFYLRSLRTKPNTTPKIDDLDLELIKSPSLTAVALRWDNITSNGYFNHNLEAIMDMVNGLTPNLKKVSLRYQRSRASAKQGRAARYPMPPWKSLVQKSGGSKPRHLQELKLNNWGANTYLQELIGLAPANLVSLEVPWLFKPQDIQCMANTCTFTSLRHLIMKTQSMVPDHPANSAFLTTIPPLESLQIDRYTPPVFQSIVQHHGPTLRSLHLGAEENLTTDSAAQSLSLIAEHFPQLEKLKFTMVRTSGDEREIKAYGLLGTMVRLREVFIVLICGKQPRVDFSLSQNLDDFDRKRFRDFSTNVFPRPIHNIDVELALLDHAVSKGFAKAIFNLVNKKKFHRSARSYLEKLVILPQTDVAYCRANLPESLIEVFHWTKRSWIIKSTQRDDGSRSISHSHYHEGEYDIDSQSEREEHDIKGGFDEPFFHVSRGISQVLQHINPQADPKRWKENWEQWIELYGFAMAARIDGRMFPTRKGKWNGV